MSREPAAPITRLNLQIDDYYTLLTPDARTGAGRMIEVYPSGSSWTEEQYLYVAKPVPDLLKLINAAGPGLEMDRKTLAILDLILYAGELIEKNHVMLSPGYAKNWEAWVLAPDPHEHITLGLLKDTVVKECLLTYYDEQYTRGIVDKCLATAVRDMTSSWPKELPVPAGSGKGAVPRWQLNNWADLGVTRVGSGARMALALTKGETWQLRPVLVANNVTIEMNGLTGGVKGFTKVAKELDCSMQAVKELVIAEATALTRSWPKCPLLVDRKNRGMPLKSLGKTLLVENVPVDAETLTDLSTIGLYGLERTGTPVLVDGQVLRLARHAKGRIRRSSSTSTGLLSIQNIALDVTLLVDDKELDTQELKDGHFVQVGGDWVALTPDQVNTLQSLIKAQTDGVSIEELLEDDSFDGVEIDPDLFIPKVKPRRVPTPALFQGTLRPYQRDGLDWLTWLEENNLGGILADDMGLGKTIQVLARIAEDHSGPSLVVAPLSLISNWKREAGVFTPSLNVLEYHGTERELLPDANIVLTTYSTLINSPELKEQHWHRIVADEAQQVKNHATATAKALRELNGDHHLAVTGTPVENHVGDLWSLMSFALPGLLGRRTPFMRKFVKEEADTTRLRMIVAPFMLRRVKTDETLGLNLPEKEVTRTDCALTTEQFSAYEKEHELMVTHLAGLDGVARRGSILSGLTRLKQVCVHPMLTPAGSVSSIIEGRSGKISKLETIVKEAISQGEAVVVFTQFASFLPHLARHLDEALNIEALTIDGTMSRKARDKSLKEFMNPEGPPVLLCSLKTGGVGLNLVRASNVVHLDRWWNPAVEDQASDRVWRIGQNQDVNVHLLVCPGTLEDKIDQLLSSKRLIAGQVVTQSEASLTELDDAALENLVSLVKDRILWEEVE